MNNISRRQLLKWLSASGAATILHAPLLTWAKPSPSSNKKLVWIMLRGAMDGLAAVPPWGEPKYESYRGKLSLPSPSTSNGIIKIDGLFGLHPAFENMFSLYAQRELTIIQAVASPYRKRSHFDAQKVIENGTAQAGTTSGWLNRALTGNNSNQALAVGHSIPLVLHGRQSVSTWAPSRLPPAHEDIFDRLAMLYEGDPLLSQRLEEGLSTANMVADQMMNTQGNRRQRSLKAFASLAKNAGILMRAENGPNVVALELGGWDTHANQGSLQGRLANQFSALDQGIAALKSSLAEEWQNTLVVVASEFGRTVRVNGTQGTDHGTAGVAFVAGGAANGGRILSDWPGLSTKDLYQGRDLMPTTDIRSVLKGALVDHMGLDEAFVTTAVFPQSNHVKVLPGLTRTS